MLCNIKPICIVAVVFLLELEEKIAVLIKEWKSI